MDFSSLNIKGVEAAQDITEPFLKVAIVGEQGVGKSWLATSGEGDTLDLDFDGRAASLQGKANVYVKTYRDISPDKATAMQEFETDLKALKYAYSQGKATPANYVIDSMTYCRKSCEAELIRQQGTLGRAVRVGATTLKIGAGWDIINANRLFLEYIINELSTLGNVFAVFHEMDEKDVQKSTDTKKAYTGMVTIQPQYLATMLSIFNDVWRVKIRYDNKRIVQTGLSNDFAGKSTLKGLDAEEVIGDNELTIQRLLQKHRNYLAKQQGK